MVRYPDLGKILSKCIQIQIQNRLTTKYLNTNRIQNTFRQY